MAYRFKKRYRKRSLRNRRRYGRYRYSRSRKYRNFRSRRRSKPEYKRIEVHDSFSETFQYSQEITEGNLTVTGLYGTYGFVHGIGGCGDQSHNFFYNITQGTAATRRIGNKINPVKLRVYGTISFTPYAEVEMITPSSVMVRCVIFQVRNGNPEYAPNDAQYSSVNPIFDWDNGRNTAASGARLFVNYPIRTGVVTINQQRVTTTFIRQDDINTAQTIAKVPFRLGIGGSIKILKDKTYSLNTGHVTSIPYRFKCKKPNRMVWPESTEDANLPFSICKNNIFMCWFIIPTARYSYNLQPRFGEVKISSSVEMFYLDN